MEAGLEALGIWAKQGHKLGLIGIRNRYDARNQRAAFGRQPHVQ
jgi:energy-converting hydrogenase Eha subunit G